MAKKKAEQTTLMIESLPTQEAQEFINHLSKGEMIPQPLKHSQIPDWMLDQIKQLNPEVALSQFDEESSPKKLVKKVKPKAKAKPKRANKTTKKTVKVKGTLQPKPISGHKADEVVFQTPANIVATKILVDEDSIDSEGNAIQWLPEYKTAGAACVDLKVNIPADVHGNRVVSLPYRSCAKIDCGFSMQLPEGFKAEVAIRSGWASKGLVLLNGPGQIDPDFTGKIMILVGNIGKEILILKHGDRVAQMYPTPIHRFAFEKVEALDETVRAAGGFGSTGVK